MEAQTETQNMILFFFIVFAVIVYIFLSSQRKKKEVEIKKKQKEELSRLAKRASEIKSNLHKANAEFQVAVKKNSREKELKK
jgi:CRISPR/Cas system-associated exonuclease Cas4 (RecB family)